MITHEQREISLKYLADLGLDPQRISKILGLKYCPNGCLVAIHDRILEENCDMLVATQTLLLSAYTPDSMTLWFKTPREGLYGQSPLECLKIGVSPIRDVLIEAHRTIM